ncbi:MAG: hypothetical protein ACKO1U_07915, partial [Bacteroidota bacterium]
MPATLLRRYRFLFQAFLFLMTLLSVWRLVFFLVNTPSHSFQQLLLGTTSFFLGLRLDLAVSAYVLAPLMLYSIFVDVPFNGLRFVRRYLAVISVILTLVLFSNVLVYHFWRSLLNYRALSYLKDPFEAVASVTGLQAFALLSVILLLFLATIWMVG